MLRLIRANKFVAIDRSPMNTGTRAGKGTLRCPFLCSVDIIRLMKMDWAEDPGGARVRSVRQADPQAIGRPSIAGHQWAAGSKGEERLCPARVIHHARHLANRHL